MNFQFLEGYNKRYKVLHQIGKGAISDVFQIKCEKENKFYALKTVSSILQKGNFGFKQSCFQKIKSLFWQLNQYFEKEVKISQYLHNTQRHQNILAIEEIIYDENNKNENIVYLVLEFCDQGDLLQFQNKYYQQFDLETKLAFCIQIALGLQYLHNLNIAHRDLKPENCFVKKIENARGGSTFHENFEIKIGDFGLSQMNNNLIQLKSQIGTPNYMAPEIFHNQNYSKKVDVWSLGCLIYEIFTNEQFFQGKLKKIIPEIINHSNQNGKQINYGQESKNINKVLKDCLVSNDKQRQDIDQIVKDLIEIYERVKRKNSKFYKSQAFQVNQNRNQSNYSIIDPSSFIEELKRSKFNQKNDNALTQKQSFYEVEDACVISLEDRILQSKNFNNQNLSKILNTSQQEKLTKKILICEGKEFVFPNEKYCLKQAQRKESLLSETEYLVVFTNQNNEYQLSESQTNFAFSFNFLMAQVAFLFEYKEPQYFQEELKFFLQSIIQQNPEKKFYQFIKEINNPDISSLFKLLVLFELSVKYQEILQNINHKLLSTFLEKSVKEIQNCKQLIEFKDSAKQKTLKIKLINSLKCGNNTVIQDKQFQSLIKKILQEEMQFKFKPAQQELLNNLQFFYLQEETSICDYTFIL